MATLNGAPNAATASPSPNPSTNIPAKRKRSDNQKGDSNGISPLTHEESKALIRDLIDVLKTHDTTPSILHRPLPPRAPSDEPQAKRHKAEGSSTDSATILSRQSSNAYATVEDVLQDIDAAVSDITEKLQLPKSANHPVPPSTSQTETSLKIAAFKKRAHELVEREKHFKAEEKKASTGVKKEEGSSSSTSLDIHGGSSDNRQVLTLYGTAGPTSKQLFSSLQIPTKINGESEKVVQTLRESGLPNGITTTQIVPVQSSDLTGDKKRVPTFGELFPTPSTVQQLQAPKVSRVAVTRSSTVGWYQPAALDSHPRNGSYFRQPVAAAQWLDYSSSTPVAGSKKKQRDRALSLGAAKAPQVDSESKESEAAKLEALFRGAYSSFGPCKDDTAAIVPAGTIDRIWFQHVGQKSFDRLVRNANNWEDVVELADNTEVAIADADAEDKMFREAVENMEDSIDPSLEIAPAKAASEKEVDEILTEISDLLRTLNSHQRNRLLYKEKAGGLLNGPDTTTTGTPSKPSTSEISIYEILKSQLTLMIASLPPYAVAKLDSDQLAELAISSKIEVHVEDHKGVMEEDETAARARNLQYSAQAVSRSQVAQHATQHRPSATAPYNNQYPTPRSAAPVQQQYYGQGQANVRPAQSSMQRPPSAAAPYPPQRPAAAAPYRSSYGTQNYQVPRQQQTAYTPQTQYQQAQSNYNRPVGQPYAGGPQTAPPAARYTSQYGQQNPPQTAGGYQYGNGVNGARQMSPQKPVNSPQTAYNQVQPRPYGTPTPSVAQRPYAANPTASMNGGSTTSHQSQQQFGPSNYATVMSIQEQSNMMERQRAQLAQQQGLQAMARTSAQAAAMGTPSKVNGNSVTAGL